MHLLPNISHPVTGAIATKRKCLGYVHTIAVLFGEQMNRPPELLSVCFGRKVNRKKYCKQRIILYGFHCPRYFSRGPFSCFPTERFLATGEVIMAVSTLSMVFMLWLVGVCLVCTCFFYSGILNPFCYMKPQTYGKALVVIWRT